MITETEPYRPSNGTEGMIFMNRFCHRCIRDEEFRKTDNGKVSCQIIADALFYRIEDRKYPKEWVRNIGSGPELIGGTGARCTVFEPLDEAAEEELLDYIEKNMGR